MRYISVWIIFFPTRRVLYFNTLQTSKTKYQTPQTKPQNIEQRTHQINKQQKWVENLSKMNTLWVSSVRHLWFCARQSNNVLQQRTENHQLLSCFLQLVSHDYREIISKWASRDRCIVIAVLKSDSIALYHRYHRKEKGGGGTNPRKIPWPSPCNLWEGGPIRWYSRYW